MTDTTTTAGSDQALISASERLPLRMRIAMGIGRPFCHMLLKIFYRVRVEGDHHVPDHGPVIMIANHQSYFDPILVGLLATRREFRAIAKSGLFKFRPFARLIALYGAIPIEQGKGDLTAFRLAIDEINKGRALVIYPEGGRSPDGTTQPFARGFHLVLKRTNACLVPVFIEGAYDVWPAGRRFPRLRGRIMVRAAKPIRHEELLSVPAPEVLRALREQIERGRVQLRQELRRLTDHRYPSDRQADQPYWCASTEDESAPNVERSTSVDASTGSS